MDTEGVAAADVAAASGAKAGAAECKLLSGREEDEGREDNNDAERDEKVPGIPQTPRVVVSVDEVH